MAEKFDPAPYDKHAVAANEAALADHEVQSMLTVGLIGTFPASDPISAIQSFVAHSANTQPEQAQPNPNRGVS